jgi:clorobiocin biosynthesis protein CloN5
VTELNAETLPDQLLYYVVNELDVGALAAEIKADSPLLELGVLDSVRTARLLAHIRSEYGLRIPPSSMTGEHFSSVETIADLILSLRPQPAAAPMEDG